MQVLTKTQSHIWFATCATIPLSRAARSEHPRRLNWADLFRTRLAVASSDRPRRSCDSMPSVAHTRLADHRGLRIAEPDEPPKNQRARRIHHWRLQQLDDSVRHDENTGCVYDFLWDKRGVDARLRSGLMCRDCFARVHARAEESENLTGIGAHCSSFRAGQLVAPQTSLRWARSAEAWYLDQTCLNRSSFVTLALATTTVCARCWRKWTSCTV